MAIYEVFRGLVLRQTETKEADKILTVLTAEKGKVSVIARGARRKGSRLAAVSQLLAYSEMTAYESRGWYMLTEGATLQLFSGLRTDVERLALASYFAELTETVTQEGEGAEEILPLLLNALYALGELKKDPAQVKAAFELRLLSLAGFTPLLDGCGRCGEELTAGGFLDAAEGGLVCPKCGSAGFGLLPLSAGALAAAEHVVTADPKKLYAFSLPEEDMKLFARAAESYALTQLERSFRTLDFYKSLVF